MVGFFAIIVLSDSMELFVRFSVWWTFSLQKNMKLCHEAASFIQSCVAVPIFKNINS